MWTRIMGINSFVVVPVLFVLVVYTGMRMISTLEWKPFLIALVALILSFIAQFVISTMMD